MTALIDLLSLTNYTIKISHHLFVKVSTLLVERSDNEGKVESVSGKVTESTAAYAGLRSIT